MKDAIAIAIAKARFRRKKFPNNSSSRPDGAASVNQELVRTILSFFLMSGVVIGLGGIICMIVGLFKSGGIKELLSGLFSALGLF